MTFEIEIRLSGLPADVEAWIREHNRINHILGRPGLVRSGQYINRRDSSVRVYAREHSRMKTENINLKNATDEEIVNLAASCIDEIEKRGLDGGTGLNPEHSLDSTD